MFGYVEPDNADYRKLLQCFRQTGQSYRQSGQGYSVALAVVRKFCMEMCMAIQNDHLNDMINRTKDHSRSWYEVSGLLRHIIKICPYSRQSAAG